MRSKSMNFRSYSAPGSETPRKPRRRDIFAGVVGLAGLLFILCVIFWFFYVGTWLVSEDPLEHAQAIAVLSGRMPVRALEAAKLYRAGYAPEVWLTRSTEPGKYLADLGVKYYGEEYYNAKILQHEGVPATAIRVLETPIVNTSDEIVVIKAALDATPLHTVIIVTTKPHTRRTRTLWRLITGGQGRAIVRAASQDPYDAERWWHNTRDSLDVVRECLGLLNAWSGLPVGH
jgi:uncharacterized SAM-binding protein YcdF (DUF218 family)